MGFCSKRYPIHCSLFWVHFFSIPVLIAALSYSADIAKKAGVARDIAVDLISNDLDNTTDDFKRGKEGFAMVAGRLSNICIGIQVMASLSLVSFLAVMIAIASLLNDFKAFPFNLIRKKMLSDIEVIVDK